MQVDADELAVFNPFSLLSRNTSPLCLGVPASGLDRPARLDTGPPLARRQRTARPPVPARRLGRSSQVQPGPRHLTGLISRLHGLVGCLVHEGRVFALDAVLAKERRISLLWRAILPVCGRSVRWTFESLAPVLAPSPGRHSKFAADVH